MTKVLEAMCFDPNDLAQLWLQERGAIRELSGLEFLDRRGGKKKSFRDDLGSGIAMPIKDVRFMVSVATFHTWPLSKLAASDIKARRFAEIFARYPDEAAVLWTWVRRGVHKRRTSKEHRAMWAAATVYIEKGDEFKRDHLAHHLVEHGEVENSDPEALTKAADSRARDGVAALKKRIRGKLGKKSPSRKIER